jgi:hypothetical protein
VRNFINESAHGTFSEFFSRLTGRPAMISKNGVEALQAKPTFNSSKAQR